jgi:thiol-disulfide isomerase/thioredoxin
MESVRGLAKCYIIVVINNGKTFIPYAISGIVHLQHMMRYKPSKKPFTRLLFVLPIVLFACNNAGNSALSPKNKSNSQDTLEKSAAHEIYQVDGDKIAANFMTWYKYTYANIRLEQNFIGLDPKGNKIGKETLLTRLASGDFIAIKTAHQEGVPVYQLYKTKHHESDIQRTIVQMAKTAMTLAAMEGKVLPDYHFTDLQGNVYDKNNTKGKVLLLKCWFIHCTACVKEFPVLNQLVEHYKNSSEVLFISLASDLKQGLISFLEKKPFSYAVVPEMGAYMHEKLQVNAYPLHLLIDRKGRIVKAANAIEDVIPSLEKEVEPSFVK